MLGQCADHVDHLAIHQPEITDVFFDPGVRDTVQHVVEQRRAVALEVTVGGSVAAFGEHHVRALLPLVNQQRNDADRVLQVDVHGDHRIARSVFQAGEQRRFLAEVARKVDQQHILVDLRQGLDLLGRPVGAAIVDEYDLDLVAAQPQLALHRLIKQADRLLFVEDRNDQRNLHVSRS
ncbi:hypothetical protein D3C84_532170 [compost metagenome]